MLDDEEFHQVRALLGKGKDGDTMQRIYGPMLAEYARITGFHETNPVRTPARLGTRATSLERCSGARTRLVGFSTPKEKSFVSTPP